MCRNIFLISNNSEIFESIKNILDENKYNIIKYTNYIPENIDLIIADVNLSSSNIIDFYKKIKLNFNLPIILVFSKYNENIKTNYSNFNMDTCILFPFQKDELILKLEQILKFSDEHIIQYKNLKIDTSTGLTTKNGKEIFLSSLEYRILLYFMNHKGIVISKTKLLGDIWYQDSTLVNGNTTAVYIKRLREKIEDEPTNPDIIKTVYGKGYIMEK